MNWRRGRNNSPPGTGGVAHSAGVVAGSNNSPSHSFIGIKENYFDFTTTPALRATPPVPGGELFLALLQFIHTFIDRSYEALYNSLNWRGDSHEKHQVQFARLVHRIAAVWSGTDCDDERNRPRRPNDADTANRRHTCAPGHSLARVTGSL